MCVCECVCVVYTTSSRLVAVLIMTSKHWCTPCCLCVVYTTPLVYTICVESHVTLSAKSAKHCVSRHRFYSARHFSTNGSGCLNQSSVCVVSYTTPRTRFCKWQLCCVSALHHLHQLPRGKQQMLQGEAQRGYVVGAWVAGVHLLPLPLSSNTR